MSGSQPRAGWRWITIGQAGEVRLGRQRTPKDHQGDHMVPYLRVANVFENRIDLGDVKQMNFTPTEQEVYLLRFGDILLNEGQSPHLVGRPAMYRGELGRCFFQNTLVRFRAGVGVMPGWALLVFRAQLHALRYMKFAKITTNIAHLGAERFAAVEFPVPPLETQQELVSALDLHESRLDAAVASLTRAKANVKRARASVLKAAVEGRLVPTEAALARAGGRDYESASALLARILAERKAAWAASGARGRYEEPVTPDTEGLPGLPEGWGWASVEQVASDLPRSIQSGPFGSSLLHSEFQPVGKLVIGIDNVQDGYFTMGSRNRISEMKYLQLAKYQARPRDLAITVMATIGRCCAIPRDIEPAIITKHVYRVTMNFRVALPEFVVVVVRSPFGREKLLMESKGQTRPGLNGSIIKALPIALPPLPEQHRIVAEVDRRLSVLDALGQGIDADLARCARLRQSILKRAFEGRLVPAVSTADTSTPTVMELRPRSPGSSPL